MTNEPIPYARGLPAVSIVNNRRGGLIAFGIISILIGVLAGCLTLGTMVAVGMTQRMGAPSGKSPIAEILIGVAFFVASTALFVWVGIDSIRCRRWVRPVVIGVGWMAILGSLLSIYIPLAMANLPTVQVSNVPATGPVTKPVTTPMTPAQVMPGFVIGSVILMLVLGIIVPGAFVWFYSTAAVRRTLEAYDPSPSWTEHCPVRVFVACTALLLGGVMTAAASGSAAVPFFGTYLTGWPAVLVNFLSGVVMIAAAVLMQRLRPLGWWLAIGDISFEFLSMVLSLCRLGMREFYRHGGSSIEELDVMAASPLMSGSLPVVLIIISGVFSAGYLVWIKRDFKTAPKSPGNGGVASIE